MIYTISKKQAGIIYRAWKEGRITAEKATINAMYEMAGTLLHDTPTEAVMDGCLNRIVTSLLHFNGRRAQENMDRFALLSQNGPAAL